MRGWISFKGAQDHQAPSPLGYVPVDYRYLLVINHVRFFTIHYLVEQVHQKQQYSGSGNGGQHNVPQRDDVWFHSQVSGDDLGEHFVALDSGQLVVRLADVRQFGHFGGYCGAQCHRSVHGHLKTRKNVSICRRKLKNC